MYFLYYTISYYVGRENTNPISKTQKKNKIITPDSLIIIIYDQFYPFLVFFRNHSSWRDSSFIITSMFNKSTFKNRTSYQPTMSSKLILLCFFRQQVEILATTDLEKRLRAIDKTLEYVAAQLRRSVCVVACDGLQTCQAVDCCVRASTSSSRLNDHASSSEDNQNEMTEFLL